MLLRSVFAFVVFVAFVVSGVGGSAGRNTDSNVGSRVEVFSKLFIGNNLLLKLLRTFFLALKNNPKLFKKYFF